MKAARSRLPRVDALPAEDAPLRLLQITDTHLYGEPEGRLLGQATRRTLELVLEHARATFWPVDRILLTGDLVHDETRQGYRYLLGRLCELDVPCSCLPGNHDLVGLMLETLQAEQIGCHGAVSHGRWRVILLDSVVAGEVGGNLRPDQLALLERELAAHPEQHALVCLHHQPVPVGSRWIDTMGLDNPEELFAVLDRYSQVRCVLWGHIHQDFTAERRGVLLLASPSTCIQFLPRSREFAVDAQPPGYRWLTLHPDGRIDTGVERIAGYPDPVDLRGNGY